MTARGQNLVVAQGVIVHPDRRRVLMAHRPPNVKKPLMWEYPGGKIEAGEGLVEGLYRELEEELGIKATIGSMLKRLTFNAKDDITLYVFEVLQWTGDFQPLASTEIRWVYPEQAVDELPSLPGVYLSYITVMGLLEELRSQNR